MSNTINNIKDFHKLFVNNKVELSFKKKDGTKRFMRATLNFSEIPSSEKPKKFDEKKFKENLKNGIIHVYDLDKNGWRSINFNTTDWAEIQHKKKDGVLEKIRYKIKK